MYNKAPGAHQENFQMLEDHNMTPALYHGSDANFCAHCHILPCDIQTQLLTYERTKLHHWLLTSLPFGMPQASLLPTDRQPRKIINTTLSNELRLIF